MPKSDTVITNFIRKNDIDSVRNLLNMKINPKKVENKLNVINIAIKQNKIDFVKLFIEYKGIVKTSMFKAVESNNYDIVKLLLENDCPTEYYDKKYFRVLSTALYHSERQKDKVIARNIIKLLLDTIKPDVNKRLCRSGSTSSYYYDGSVDTYYDEAIAYGDVEIVKMFIEHGAKWDQLSPDGINGSLELAWRYNQKDIFNYFLEKQQTNNNWFKLFEIYQKWSSRHIRTTTKKDTSYFNNKILEKYHRENQTVCDIYNEKIIWTLSYYVKENKINKIKKLLGKIKYSEKIINHIGCLFLKNKNLRTIINFEESLLDETGKYNIDNTVKMGNDVLHNTIKDGDHQLLRLLIKLGCDITKPDKDGMTPLLIANIENNKKCVKLLQKNIKTPENLPVATVV